MTDDYAIFVGGKPFMNYVTAVVMQFTTKGADKVVIRSRGKFISRAVDVAEVVKSRFLKDQVEVTNISMDSEEFKNNEGRIVRVSTLDIKMERISNPTLNPVEEPTKVSRASKPKTPVEEPEPIEEPEEIEAENDEEIEEED